MAGDSKDGISKDCRNVPKNSDSADPGANNRRYQLATLSRHKISRKRLCQTIIALLWRRTYRHEGGRRMKPVFVDQVYRPCFLSRICFPRVGTVMSNEKPNCPNRTCFSLLTVVTCCQKTITEKKTQFLNRCLDPSYILHFSLVSLNRNKSTRERENDRVINDRREMNHNTFYISFSC